MNKLNNFKKNSLRVMAAIAIASNTTNDALAQNLDHDNLNYSIGYSQSYNNSNTVDSINTRALSNSIALSGVEQVNFFKNFFGISDFNFKEGVITIQRELGVDEDGILGPDTLLKVYDKYYKNNPNIPLEISKRIEIENLLRNYPKGTTGMKTSFDNELFYGVDFGENMSGYYINENLYQDFIKENAFSYDPADGKNVIYARKYKGKYIIELYVEGQIGVLTYMSPGKNGISKKINGTHTPQKMIKEKYSYSHHNARMPYGVQIRDGYFIHGRWVNGNPASAGCLGVPLLYADGIWYFLKEFGEKSFKIKISV